MSIRAIGGFAHGILTILDDCEIPSFARLSYRAGF